MSVATKFDIIVQKSVDKMSNLPKNCDNFTLENSFFVNFMSSKASRIIQNRNIIFYTWVRRPLPPLYTMCKKNIRFGIRWLPLALLQKVGTITSLTALLLFQRARPGGCSKANSQLFGDASHLTAERKCEILKKSQKSCDSLD